MKQFVFKVFTFSSILLMLIVSDILLQRTILFGRTYFELPSNVKIVFFGHSHPECAFNDSLISNSVNVAQSGESYFYTYFKLKNILGHNKQVRTVFLEYTNNQIDKSMDNWIWDGTHLQSNFIKYSPFIDFTSTRLLYLKNPSGVLNGLGKSLVDNPYAALTVRNVLDDNFLGGYKYLIREKIEFELNMESSEKVKPVSPNEVSETNLLFLKRAIRLCEEKKVKVVFVRSPLHPRYKGFSNEKTFQAIRQKQFPNVPFWDFRDFPLEDSEYGDLEHLNHKGARKFSVFFNRIMKDGVLNRKNSNMSIDYLKASNIIRASRPLSSSSDSPASNISNEPI